MVQSAGIAQFALYGETEGDGSATFIHIEDIYSRARLHDWHIDPHVHRHMYQLVYVHTGKGEVWLDGRHQLIEGPCAVSIPGSVVHGFAFGQDAKGWVLTVSEQSLLDARFQDSQKLLAPLLRETALITFQGAGQSADGLNYTLARVADEFYWQKPGSRQMLEWLVRIALMVIRRHWDVEPADETGQGKRRRLFTRFRRLLEDQYREHVSVTDYARKLAVSQAQLNRLCKAFTGKGANQLMQDRLLVEAQRYLMYTSATAAMISYELGFQDPAYFSRFFKRQTGMAPGQYRKNIEKSGLMSL